MAPPLAYFITFHCYGTWLRGEEPGWVDQQHNQPGTDFLAPDSQLQRAEPQQLDQPPYSLDAQRRRLVMQAIQGVCAHRGWRLLAVHVRTTHVHVVVTVDQPPEKVMNDFKAYASRALNAASLDPPNRKRWSRHGSTRYLNDAAAVDESVDYVLRRQGEPLEVYDGTTAAVAADEPRPSGSGDAPPLPHGRGS